MNKIALVVIVNLGVVVVMTWQWYQGTIPIDAGTILVTLVALLICNGALGLGFMLRRRAWPVPSKKPLLLFAIGFVALIDAIIERSSLMSIASLGVIALGILTVRQQRRDGNR